jgi:hypothetical protein
LLIAAVGWVVFFFVFRTVNTADSDDDAPTGPLPRLDPPLQTETALQGPLPPHDRVPEGDR